MNVNKPIALSALIFLVATGCSGTDDVSLDPSSLATAATNAVSNIKDAVGDQSEIVDNTVNLVKDIANDTQKAVPQEIRDLSNEERDKIAKDAVAQAKELLAKAENEVSKLTPEQVEELKGQAQKVLSGGVQALRTSIGEVLTDDKAPVKMGEGATIRVGVNSLGGYAATSSYLWLYALRQGGFKVERVVGTGQELTNLINNGDIDITFEALPNEVQGETLGTWATDSEFPMRISGRKGFAKNFPVLTQALKSYALSTKQIDSLVPSVHTRGVAEVGSQDAAIETWLLSNPEVITQLR